MNSQLTFFLAFFCVVPATVGAIIYKRVAVKYLPFIYIMWLTLATELTARCGIIMHQKVIITTAYNLYYPVSFSCFVLFFYNMQLIKNRKMAYVLIALSLLAWSGAWLYYKTWLITFVFSYLFNGIIIIVLSIELLSQQVLQYKKALLRNFLFWMPATCILQFGVYIFITTAMMLVTVSPQFRGRLFSIFMIVNACSYLLYAFALLCLHQNKTGIAKQD